MSEPMHISSGFSAAALGYRWPAEWEPHAATLMSWPTNRDTWPGEHLDRVLRVYISILRVLSRFEPVLLAVPPDRLHELKKHLENELPADAQLYLIPYQTNDVWARDYAPFSLVRDQPGMERETLWVNWVFNSWGGKYPPWNRDHHVPEELARRFGVPLLLTDTVLEGGAVDSNGSGVVMTTESVLLNPNRNPGLDRSEMESILRSVLGVEQILWLWKGLQGDDTDGHIDDLSRFVSSETIVTMDPSGTVGANREALEENLNRLKKARTRDGRAYEILPLPMPETRSDEPTIDGSTHVPASYANFYIANGGVLVPLYEPDRDEEVLALFRRLFPDREIVGLPCADLVWGQGSIHCITHPLFGLNRETVERGGGIRLFS